MNKLFLATAAIAAAFAFTACCDKNYCPNKLRCSDRKDRGAYMDRPFDRDDQMNYPGMGYSRDDQMNSPNYPGYPDMGPYRGEERSGWRRFTDWFKSDDKDAQMYDMGDRDDGMPPRDNRGFPYYGQMPPPDGQMPPDYRDGPYCDSCRTRYYNWLEYTPYRWDRWECTPRNGQERIHRRW